MKTIKTRSAATKGVKALNKTVSLASRMKGGLVKTKDKAEETQQSHHSSPSDYAADKIQHRAQDAVDTVVHRAPNPVRQVHKNLDRTRDSFREVKRQQRDAAPNVAHGAGRGNTTPRQQSDKPDIITHNDGKLPETPSKTKPAQSSATPQKTISLTGGKPTNATSYKPINTANAPKSGVSRPGYLKKGKNAPKKAGDTARTLQRTAKKSGKAAKSTAKGFKQTAKGTIKTAKKSVKTAEKFAKVAVKTAKITAKTAAKTAAASAKAAKAAAIAAKATAKAAVVAAKVAAKVVIATIKAAILAIKGMVALIAAGGWVVIVIILVICLVGLLVGSIFGIFFSDEDTGTGRIMPAVVNELTAEFYGKIEDIKNENSHDIEVISPRPEVLAVYAVRVNTDPANAADVVTLDDDKVERLRDVLDDMVALSHALTYHTEEHTVIDDDGEETTETVTISTLTISMTQKSVDEMAAQYGFCQEQKDMVAELLSPEYADLWAMLLGGYVPGSGEILIGNISRIPNYIFSWPVVDNHPVTSLFGNRSDPFTGQTRFHGGIDISAPEGTPILAAADGIVIVANSTDSWGGGWGYYVKIQHEGGYMSLYAHCVRIAVVKNQEVKKGEVIAFVGTTGRSTGNHLHWEVYKDGVRVNPLGYFG